MNRYQSLCSHSDACHLRYVFLCERPERSEENEQRRHSASIRAFVERKRNTNLMGTYSFSQYTSGRNFKAATELFTTYDDTVIEQLWGRYTGKDAAWRCYGIINGPTIK